jgi:hypothetical protein
MTIEKVYLYFNTGTKKIEVTVSEVQIHLGDKIEFIADDDNLYTVNIVNANTYFETPKKVLSYDVSKYLDSSAITPPAIFETAGHVYTVIVTTASYAETTDSGPDAPPKIIIVPSV